jgi:LAGLIDADG DNA endonuclease family protein
MNLSREAQSIVVGSLLGDAYLTPNGSLQIEHRLDHAEYVVWKYEGLTGIVGRPPRIVERLDKRTSRIYRSMRFYTRTVLKPFRSLFYRNGVKIVPESLGEFLDPQAIAVWFMDDGGRGARTPRGLVINTSGFSELEQVRLKDILADRFDVQASIHRVGSGFQLYIRAESFNRFSGLVSRYLVAPMRYKLPADPVTTSPPRRRDGGLVRESEPIYGLHDTSALIHQ